MNTSDTCVHFLPYSLVVRMLLPFAACLSVVLGLISRYPLIVAFPFWEITRLVTSLLYTKLEISVVIIKTRFVANIELCKNIQCVQLYRLSFFVTLRLCFSNFLKTKCYFYHFIWCDLFSTMQMLIWHIILINVIVNL